MAKSKRVVEEKMRERVQSAGKYLKLGMEEAEDPIDVILKDPDEYARRLEAGLKEAMRKKKYEAGLRKAKERNAWKNSQERAAAHYEERTDDMVKHTMEGYEARASIQDRVKEELKGMPRTTRAQKIAYGGKYQLRVGEEMDKLYGRA